MQWLFWVATFLAGVVFGYRLRMPRVEIRYHEVRVDVPQYVYVPVSERLAARMKGDG